MKNRVLHSIMILSLVLIGLSFLIPNEFNDLLLTYPELFQNFSFAYSMYSLTLLIVVILLSFFQLDIYAYWISLLFLILQTFNMGIVTLLNLGWIDYLIISVGILIVFMNFYYYSIDKRIKKKLLFGLGALSAIFVLLSVIVYPHADNVYSVLIVLFIGALISLLIKRIDFRIVIILQTIFVFLLLYLMTLNTNCNIRFELDMGFKDWSIKNLYSRCSSFYLWIMSGIIMNYCLLIKLKKATGPNKRS